MILCVQNEGGGEGCCTIYKAVKTQSYVVARLTASAETEMCPNHSKSVRNAGFCRSYREKQGELGTSATPGVLH